MKKLAVFLVLLIMFSGVISAQDLEFLSNTNYVNSIDYLVVVGEIQNNSNSPYTYVQIIGSFFDEAGNIVDTDSTYTLIDTIPPGGTSPFKISIKDNSNIKKYNLQAQGRPGQDQPRNLEMVSSTSSVNKIGYFVVTGQVKNNGSEPLEYVQIIGTFYNEQGEVLDTDSTYSSLDVIPPGGTSPFKLSIKNNPDITKYLLQVQ